MIYRKVICNQLIELHVDDFAFFVVIADSLVEEASVRISILNSPNHCSSFPISNFIGKVFIKVKFLVLLHLSQLEIFPP